MVYAVFGIILLCLQVGTIGFFLGQYLGFEEGVQLAKEIYKGGGK